MFWQKKFGATSAMSSGRTIISASLTKMAEYEPIHKPVRINPLIRATRYGMIIGGIIYGARRYSNLKTQTKGEQEEILRQIERRDANKAAKKKILAKTEMIDLAKDAGITPK